MKITHVEYKALYNLGNYNNESIALRATVEEGETPDEVVEQLRQKAIALNAGSNGDADELYGRIYRYKQSLESLENKIKTAAEQWNQTADFLKAQGLNPDAPKLSPFNSLLQPAEEEVLTPELDEF
ncbi:MULTISPECIES: hypothetical protein [Cyanophyceae]|uniref:hypothetical protein n=1 Tax=Cyanophyceae TaxID=3028117 RepID=UPI0016820AC2|nr:MULTISPECIES: hypothetical protein [Cyanophyceae]MBD1917183.1 hypothetical protein [Phormidium sp. FACHB-77]MBD2030714.1 hypothetical protein [Phormidium sp. FACHB-322]MBD2050178.1 hypothetical protein [Leptolyngbya sp. FACHB-60]